MDYLSLRIGDTVKYAALSRTISTEDFITRNSLTGFLTMRWLYACYRNDDNYQDRTINALTQEIGFKRRGLDYLNKIVSMRAWAADDPPNRYVALFSWLDVGTESDEELEVMILTANDKAHLEAKLMFEDVEF